ncbi:MAG TPA: flagellar biosynthesis protein FlhA [Opitutaceae bacterium]|nr:flagellar biosynthesis protein FlhA [Opitutaceae bacterium]
MPVSSSSFVTKLLARADLLFTFALFGTVLLLVLPVPPFLIDSLIAMNIGSALLVLLAIVYVKDPPEFSGFPTLLLALTLFRLALNISSTRQILTNGYAGDIIDSFGNFVVQGNFIVGAVVFLILVLINFVVITKGAGRIAEVSARFTLDALPGKQMAIDAELNAGVIDEAAATARRIKVQKEADFYGAMDGASKFVRGDAIAGILITLVNIVGGFAIGVFQMDLSLSESMQKFTLLSIGDGLVSQIPALIISISAGLLVTRASDQNNLGTQIVSQIVRYPKALNGTAAFLVVFGLLPGMPLLPFLGLAGLAAYMGRALKGVDLPGAAKPGMPPTVETAATPVAPSGPEDVRKLVDPDIFAIEVGYGLLPLAEVKSGGDLLARVTGARKSLARERGIIVPPISVRDNLELEPNEYRFLLRGRVLARGTLQPGRFLAMNVAGSSVKLHGVPTREPVFNLEATWIDDNDRQQAEIHGFTVVDPSSVLITHLTELLKAHAHLLLGRQDVQALVDHLKPAHGALIAELIPDLVGPGVIQRVLQNLLREHVAILNLPLILEGIADFASLSKNPDDLSELVRRRLGIYFVPEYECRPGFLRGLTLEPRLEQILISKIHRSPTEVGLALDPSTARHLIEEINRRSAALTGEGLATVIIVSAELRLPLRRFLEPSFPRVVVLAFQELPPATEVENSGIITAPTAMRAEPVIPRAEPALVAA